jgi:hypothetical protein
VCTDWTPNLKVHGDFVDDGETDRGKVILVGHDVDHNVVAQTISAFELLRTSWMSKSSLCLDRYLLNEFMFANAVVPARNVNKSLMSCPWIIFECVVSLIGGSIGQPALLYNNLNCLIPLHYPEGSLSFLVLVELEVCMLFNSVSQAQDRVWTGGHITQETAIEVIELCGRGREFSLLKALPKIRDGFDRVVWD